MEYMSRLQKIQELKEELRNTDYIALKAYEGQDCSQYGDWKAARQELRDEINRVALMTDEAWDEENRAAMSLDDSEVSE